MGHYEQVWLTCERPTSVDNLATLLRDTARCPWIRFFPGPAGDGLSSLATIQHRDEVLVGRLRAQYEDGSGTRYCLTIAADNLRLGAATNAVRIGAKWFPTQDPALV